MKIPLTFSSPVATAEFSRFVGVLSAALSQHHLSGFGLFLQTWRGVGGDSRTAALFSRLQAGEAGGCCTREQVRGDGKGRARGWAAAFWILELLCGIWPEVLRGMLWVGFSAAGPVPKSGRGSCTSLDPREGGREETAAWGLEISGALGCSCPRF